MATSAAVGTQISYVDLLSAVGETNRCPGGKRTIARVARDLNIGPDSRVLEIGCNTGFTSIELVKFTGCRSVGIDVSASAVREAERWRSSLPATIADRIDFRVGDAEEISVDDESFDVVICGGANSFVRDPRRAMLEYHRVLRPYGFLSITNLHYRVPPPEDLLDDLEEILGFRLQARDMREWLDVFVAPGWEFYDLTSHPLRHREDEVVDDYVDALCSTERLDSRVADADVARIRESWRDVMHCFNRNHRYLSYFQLYLRKDCDPNPEQPELFLAPGSYDPFFTHDFVDHHVERLGDVREGSLA